MEQRSLLEDKWRDLSPPTDDIEGYFLHCLLMCEDCHASILDSFRLESSEHNDAAVSYLIKCCHGEPDIDLMPVVEHFGFDSLEAMCELLSGLYDERPGVVDLILFYGASLWGTNNIGS